MQKLTIQDIRDFAKKKSWNLISDKYISSGSKLKWRCNEGHEFESCWDNVKQGHNCPHCTHCAKLTIKEFKDIAESKGGECLSKEYINNHAKLKFRCKKMHEWSTSPSKIKQGQWCPLCLGKYQTILDMKDLAKFRKGLCLSDKYINSKTKLKWQCSKGHKWEATPAQVKHHSWCPDCSKSKKLTIELVKELAQKRGGECLSDKYISNSSKLKFRCREGHIWYGTAADLRRGNWCRKCGHVTTANKRRKITMMEIKNTIFPLGFVCLSEKVQSVDEKLRWKCKEGHVWTSAFYHIRAGHGCPECSKGISERICRAYFENFFNEKFPSIKRLRWLVNSKGNLMELDGYCEKLNLAFEYQGHQHFRYIDIFHKEESDLDKRKEDDSLKRQICEGRGLNLIEIPYSIPHNLIGHYILKECDKRGIYVPNRDKELDYLTFEIYSPDKLKFYQDFAEKNNAECLSKVYINNTTPLKIKCKICGTIWNIRPSNIKSGKWCPTCARNKLNKNMEEKYKIKRTIAFNKAKEIVKSHNAKLVSDKIETKETRLEIICDKDHHFKIRYDHLLNGHWCNICHLLKIKEK